MDSCLDSLREILDRHHVPLEVIAHPHAATSQEASAALGVSGYAFAKAVVAMVDERPHLFVLRAADRLDIDSLRSQFAPSAVRIAAEHEAHPLFPGCESGGVPAVPFRDDVPVILDRRLTAASTITFEAGSGDEAVRMSLVDYRLVVQPRVLDIADAPARRRRRDARQLTWRRAVLQAVPFAAAMSAMLLAPRVARSRKAAVRNFAFGMVAGVTASWLTDPASGRRRRALVRDRPSRWVRTSLRRVDQRSRYLGGKFAGLRHRASE